MVHDGFSTDGYGDSESEDDMFDFGGFNPYGMAMGDMSDGMFNEVYNNCGTMGFGGEIDDYVSHQLGDDYMNDQPYAMDFDRLDTSSSNLINDEDESDTCLSGKRKFLKTMPEKELKTKRHLTILRTNRQIYDEASALLHSDLTIDVNAGDVMTDSPGNAIVKPTKNVWRHAPFKGFGFTDSNGQTVYKSFPWDGPVDPHVFARFEKIAYHADFDFGSDVAAPRLFINNDLSVRAEDATKFVSYLTTAKSTTRWFENPIPGRPFDNGPRETLRDVTDITISSVTVTQSSTAEIIQKVVDLLSSSPLIRHLEIIVDLDVRCTNFDDVLDFSSDAETNSEQDAKDDEKMEAANERATELFIESGVLDSFRKLSNVKCFSLKIDTAGLGDKVMKPQQKYLKMIEDLKKAIEKN